MMNVTRPRRAFLNTFVHFISNYRPNCEKCRFFVKNNHDRTSVGFCRRLCNPILFSNSPRCGGLLYEEK
jgi:hypothetical protein